MSEVISEMVTDVRRRADWVETIAEGVNTNVSKVSSGELAWFVREIESKLFPSGDLEHSLDIARAELRRRILPRFEGGSAADCSNEELQFIIADAKRNRGAEQFEAYARAAESILNERAASA